MTFRYLAVNDYGDVFGTDDAGLARETWDSGEYILIDTLRGVTYEEDDDTESNLEFRPIGVLVARPGDLE